MESTAQEPVIKSPRPRPFTWARIVALVLTASLLMGLTYLRFASSPETVSVPQGAHAMLGFAAIMVLSLLWLARRVRKRGAAGRKTSLAARTVVPIVLGLGGWFLAALIVLTLWPTLSLSNEVLGIVSASAPIALGLYLAWTHRDWDRATKIEGLLAASAGALLGGWFGFTATSGLVALFTTIIGAAAAGNLALIVAEVWRDRSAPPAVATVPSAAGSLAPGDAVAGHELPPGPGRND